MDVFEAVPVWTLQRGQTPMNSGADAWIRDLEASFLRGNSRRRGC